MTDLMVPQTEPTGFYGPYRGIVTNTSDPTGQNRLKAVVPQLFGNTTTETDWALPCQLPGLQSLPSPGQGVWIMFEGGDLNYPVFMGMWQPEPSVAPYEVAGAGASAVAQAETYVNGLGFIAPLYFSVVNNSPSPSTISNSSSNTYTMGTFTLPAQLTIRAMGMVTWSIPASQYQGLSIKPWIDSADMATLHATGLQNTGTSVGTPQYTNTGFGNGRYAAGQHTLQLNIGVGGGGSTATIVSLWAEVQVVSL